MMLIAGTIPLEDLPLTMGVVKTEGDFLAVDGRRIPCVQGTGAMISAALAVTNYLGLEAPSALVVGDIGQGKGSRQLYEYLIANISQLAPEVLGLHYCLPIMALMRRLCESIAGCARRPVIIADAGAMYAAKAAGLATSFDIFTPDPAEMAFLADPEATHPAYIAKHLFNADMAETPNLVRSAYQHRNAARLLLVKGAVDYIVEDGKILATVVKPDIPALEAIGGTGDTITGLVSALAYAGLELPLAATIAAKANRMAGQLAQPTPATKVSQIIAQFPAVLENHLDQWRDDGCLGK